MSKYIPFRLEYNINSTVLNKQIVDYIIMTSSLQTVGLHNLK